MSPIYDYACHCCEKEWEAIHSIDERLNEFCCNEKANLILSTFSARPKGITKELPPLNKREQFASQVYDKDGNKKIDNTKANKMIGRVNKTIAKENIKRGYKIDD